MKIWVIEAVDKEAYPHPYFARSKRQAMKDAARDMRYPSYGFAQCLSDKQVKPPVCYDVPAVIGKALCDC